MRRKGIEEDKETSLLAVDFHQFYTNLQSVSSILSPCLVQDIHTMRSMKSSASFPSSSSQARYVPGMGPRRRGSRSRVMMVTRRLGRHASFKCLH